MTRQRLLGAALMATLATSAGLALVPDAEPEAPVAPATVPRAFAAAPAAMPSSAPPSPRSRPWPEPDAQALAAWTPPVPPAPPAPSPPPPPEAARPRAPAFPYQWIGRLEQDGVASALLDGPQRSFAARAGDVLDGQWRIDRVRDTRLEVTWLPAAEQVALAPR